MLMSSLIQLSILLFFRPHNRYATSHLSALFTIYTRDAEILLFQFGRCQLFCPSFHWSPFVKCLVHKKLRSYLYILIMYVCVCMCMYVCVCVRMYV